MPSNPENRSVLGKLRQWTSGSPRINPSLFHYIDEKPEPGPLSGIDWSLLRHPIRSIREEWCAPRTRASLFHYVQESGSREPVGWRELIEDLFTGYRFALFIPSLWTDPGELVASRADLRTRRMEAGVASFMIHVMIISLAVWGIWYKHPEPLFQNNPLVFIHSPMNLPFDLGGREEGGGGGGGGKHEKLPASGGRMPDATRVQLMPPDPGQPQPLVNPDNAMDVKASVQMPIEFTVDSTLPIGDMTAPLGNRFSSGPGSGGGIGPGSGTGIGPGDGPGYGPGAKGGIGGGPDGGIGPDRGGGVSATGSGVILPEIISKPLPAYTDEARRARTEGVVVLQVIIRANGTVDGIRVIRGLGHGLDESAVRTVATQWRFKPARFRGLPIDFQATIEVSFRLY